MLSGFESSLRMTEDVEKAKLLSSSFHMPIALVFVGSDWCTFSQKLLKNVLSDEGFVKEVMKKVIFVKMDFPELNSQFDKDLLEQHFLLKNKFHVTEFPTVVLTDERLEEIARFGYESQKASEYASQFTECIDCFEQIQSQLAQALSLNFSCLKKLYHDASKLGAEALKERIIEKGLICDEEAYFHLEKYAKADKKLKSSIKETIHKKWNHQKVLLRLALMDFQEGVANGNGTLAIKPLIEYAKKEGLKEKDESFRVHLLIASHLFKEGLMSDAIEHAKIALKAAPEPQKALVKKTIKLYTAEMIAQKDL